MGKKRRPKLGDKISVRAGTYEDDPWREGVITDMLSVQFIVTAEVPKPGGGWWERGYFAFFTSEGHDWKFAE